MPLVTSTTEAAWGPATGVNGSPLEVVWEFGTLVTSLGGAYTPGAPPAGGTPTAPSTDADFTIGPGPFYYVAHSVQCIDLRNSDLVEFDSASMSVDDGAACWTLTAVGKVELFQRFTTGDVPIIEFTANGNIWRFVIEGVQRSRAFDGSGVTVTGRSLSILAGEPYQFPQNWVNDGPTTAQQIATQAQVFTGLEVDWELDDWLVPDRTFAFTGSPLAVVSRVAESVGAVMRASRDQQRIALLPRYRWLPNEWREQVPDVEIHLDAVLADSYERADKPAYNGIFVAGEAGGVIARIYLSGTLGDKLAPMVTDALLTENAALRQRGESILGQGGPQAIVRITLPVLDEPGFPGVFELNWLCRVVEPGSTWYGVVRAVNVSYEFGRISQTITLEWHTADIEGTTVTIPAPEPPPAQYIAWRVPVLQGDGAPAAPESNSGTNTFSFAASSGTYFALIAGYVSGTVTWSSTWTSPFGDDAPSVIPNGPSNHYVDVQYPTGEIDTQTSRGTLLITASVDGVPLPNRLRIVTTEPEATITTVVWSSEPNA